MFHSWGMSDLAPVPLDSNFSPDVPGTASGVDACVAADVVRGIKRLFARNEIWCVEEMALRTAKGPPRRADLMGVDARGRVVIVEVKVARGDLLGDNKWPDYLEFCDRFFWGLPPGLDRAPLETAAFQPDCCGVIVADGYDGEIIRPAPLHPLSAARRKALVERLARIAMRRHSVLLDPHCADFGGEG